MDTPTPSPVPTPVPGSAYALSARASSLQSSAVRDLLAHANAPGMISMAGGLPAPALFDVEGVRAATDSVLRIAPYEALQYGMTEGQPRLRAVLAQRMAQGGVAMAGRELIVTTGSQQALDLMARLLIDEGDVVVVENPTYLAALQAFGLCKPRYRVLEVDREGGRVDQLVNAQGEWATAPKPRLVYVVANFGNPSSATMSLQRRLDLLRWATAHEVFVLEDDPYGDLRTEGKALPSLVALSARVPGSERWCGLTSTLSKTLAPGLRVGWLVLPAPLAAAAARLKQAVDLHTSSFCQEVAATYLESGRMDAHLKTVRAEYASRRHALADALQQAFGGLLRFDEPAGGMFVWARFEDGTDTRRLLPHALAAGVAFVPGDVFYARDPDRATLRLSFTTHGPERLVEGVRRLAAAHAALRLSDGVDSRADANARAEPDADADADARRHARTDARLQAHVDAVKDSRRALTLAAPG